MLVIDGDAAEPVGLSTFVDARDGTILVREDIVDHSTDDPEWEVFPLSPPVDYSATDTRVRWCFTPLVGCDEVVGTSASPRPWDVPTSNQQQSSQTTDGNNSFAVHNWFSNDPFSVGTELATPRPARDYAYAWQNQWFEDQCAPTTFESPQRNDIDAARANLFAMHNRMHDWSYHLGFTEATWNMQDNNFQLRAQAGRPRAGQRPGRRGERRPADLRRPRQRQPDHAPGRARADHQHVPVAADRRLLLRPVRRR